MLMYGLILDYGQENDYNGAKVTKRELKEDFAMKKMFKLFAVVLSFVMVITILTPISTAQAATIKLNCTKKTIYEGDTFKLKVKGTKKKVKWSSSNEGIASVNSKGVVTGECDGKATITAKVAGKKLKCKIVVKEYIIDDDSDNDNSDNDATTSETKPIDIISNNIATLKKYIKNNGGNNSNGDCVINQDMDGVLFAIVYEESTDTLEFIMTKKNEYACTMDMTSPSNIETLEVKFAYSSDGLGFMGTGYVNPFGYSRNSKVNFSIQPSQFESYLQIQNVCNSAVGAAFSGWDMLLYKDLGISMKDIGFVKFV